MSRSIGTLALIAALVTACGTSGTQGPADCARVAASRDWSTERSYLRGVVPRGDTVQLGLAGRGGASIRATVRAPDGTEWSSSKTQEQRRGGGETHYVARYPADFAPEGMTGTYGLFTAGTYAVRWEANGALVACDTFEVSQRGVADAQPCAPAGWSVSAPASSVIMRRGNATMSVSGDQRTLGVVGDPWYVFEPNDRETITFADGTTGTLIVGRRAAPRRVAGQFRVSEMPFRFEATADAVPDIVELSRALLACAQARIGGSTTATTPSACGGPRGTLDPRPSVFPPTATLKVGGSQQFVAAHQEAGCFESPTRVTWAVSPPALGTIGDDGVFTAREVGTGTVTASTTSRFTGSATVRVER